jgi:hypothetical protein
MKKLAWSFLFILSATCLGRAQGSIEALPAFTQGSINASVFGTGGWTFHPLEGLQVTELGCLDFLISDQGEMTIGFWDNFGTLLASRTIGSTNELVNQTRYGVVTPFLLSAGQTYRLGAYSSSGGVFLNLIGQPPDLDGSATLDARLQLGASASGAGGFVFPGTLGPAGSMYPGPTFRFRNIPEPSVFSLLGLGALALYSVAFRRSR